MYKAVIFYLDGTLVQTEKLKALSYARAAAELKGGDLVEEDVIEGFKEVVGQSRKEVSTYLLAKFGLGDAARSRMEEFHDVAEAPGPPA
jgi:beta-phosphoglucomutase